MKIGVSLRIDVSKIDRDKDLFKGAKGTYLNMTTFIDLDQKDEFGNNGFIAVEESKEQRERGEKGAILGNSKVFWVKHDEQGQHPAKPQHFAQPSPHANNPQGYAQNQAAQYAATHQAQAPQDDFSDDIPFN